MTTSSHREHGTTAVTFILWILTFASFSAAIVFASWYAPSDSGADLPENPHRMLVLGLIAVGAVLALVLRTMSKQSKLAGSTSGGAELGTADLLMLRDKLAAGSREVAGYLRDEGDSQLQTRKDDIETLLRENVEPIVEQREALAQRIGLGPFSEFLSDISRGERNLNRAWSALTDRHVEAAGDALQAAEGAFAHAKLES